MYFNTIKIESFNFPAKTESEKKKHKNIYSDGTNKYTNNTMYLLGLQSFGE